MRHFAAGIPSATSGAWRLERSVGKRGSADGRARRVNHAKRASRAPCADSAPRGTRAKRVSRSGTGVVEPGAEGAATAMAGILKFKCEQCGQRIAVQPRHLNRLITCPECGQATHPLAEQIVSARGQVDSPRSSGRGGRKAAKASPEPQDTTDRACANCGDLIGRLQKQHAWEGKVVCKACHGKLSNESTRAGAPAAREETEPPKKARGGGRWRSKKSATKAAETVAEPVAARVVLPADAPAREGGPLTLNLAPRSLSGGAENLRVIPMTLGTTWAMLRGRLIALLVVVCILSAAIYGAMSLLRDIAGLVASIAFVMLAAVATWLLLRAGLQAGRRFVASRMKSAASPSGGAESGSPVTVEVTKALPHRE